MPGQSSEAASTRALYNQSQELEGLQRVFDGIDKNNDKKVDVDEMHDTIRRLGYKCSKKEVADMMWEVDEDADGALEWSEFKLMYQRVRADKSGWEPRKLFTMIEFMMHDKDGSGTIDADECTQILYRRYSPAEVDAKVKEFMSHDTDGASMDAAEISFSEYVAMEKASLEELMKSHPTFRYSRGIVEDTRAEIRRAMKGTTRAH
uniref:EF-hand domain-containing protein n=1 Tax=Emiliania huxleyi TaxID=2903 RepID=A0A7S3RNL6_EMIHU